VHKENKVKQVCIAATIDHRLRRRIDWIGLDWIGIVTEYEIIPTFYLFSYYGYEQQR
jgi:hypothetical protein